MIFLVEKDLNVKVLKMLDYYSEPNSDFDEFISYSETPVYSYEQFYLAVFARDIEFFLKVFPVRPKRRITKRRFKKGGFR